MDQNKNLTVFHLSSAFFLTSSLVKQMFAASLKQVMNFVVPV
jgi:hypothetical protein